MAKKSKKIEEEYIRISENSSKFAEYGQKVQRGELVIVYYGVDNDIGYFYYKKVGNGKVE